MADEFPIPLGRYQLVERLAVGGMAELYIATAAGEHGFAKKLVIKRLLPHLAREASYNAMFVNEAKLTAQLVHPKIAQTYELGRSDDSLYIVMEYVDGIDALGMLRELATHKKAVPTGIAVWIVHEVLDALDYAHNLKDEKGELIGVVHRDISPSNVLLSRRGDVKLVDFGIARPISPNGQLTRTGTLKGKYGYMSPEQVNEQDLDGRSDLFSLGIVLAEMLCGRRLFAAANELDVLLMVRDVKLGRLDIHGKEIEPGLDKILRRALKKSLDERWQSAAAFRDALGEWMFEQRVRVTPKTVADLVESLRDAIEAQRKESLLPAEPEVPGPSASASDGVPGALDIGESMPVIMVEDAEPSVPIMMPIATITNQRLGTGSHGDRKLPPPEAEAIDITFDDEPSSAAPVPMLTSERSARYPSIEAAINALAPEAPDPSARDFDGSTVGGPARKATLPPNIGTAATLAPPTSAPTLDDIADAPDDTGDFAISPPLSVLYRLMTSKATGLLVCSAGAIKKEIYVREGMPEYVSSNVASELFGNYLVHQGVLASGELAMALAMMPHYSGKLGDTLVGLGLLRPLEVFRHLARQVRAKLVDVCTWSKGNFSWYAGRQNQREAFPLDLNIYEVLGAGAMSIPDNQVKAWIERHERSRLRASRSHRVTPERFEIPGLRELFRALDGRNQVSELLRKYPDAGERLKAARMLLLVEQTELAKPAKGTSVASER